MKPGIPNTEIIEVVIKKKITVKKYHEIREDLVRRGWKCKAYQLDYYSGDNLKDELITE